MAIEGFDYKGFAASMAEQAKELVPADLNDYAKEYIVKTLGNYTMLAGEALYNDDTINLTAEQASLITQLIAEWSYHKSIDLVHSGILPEHWDSIMQKIAFTIFEIAKLAITKNLPQEQLLQTVEHHVTKVYKQSIEELEKRGLIDSATKERAESQSNIDEMAKQAQAEAQKKMQEENNNLPQNNEPQPKKNTNAQPKNNVGQSHSIQGITNKQMKLMSLALLLKVLSQDKVTTILDKFDETDSKEITQYMDMADLASHIDSDLISECLQDIKSYLPIKRKLTKENVLLDLSDIYKEHSRESVESIIKNERPYVKRFIAKSYEGEYENVPLRVAGIIQEYIKDSLK